MKTSPVVATLVASLLIGGTAVAAPVFVDEEKGIAVNVGVLAQPWFQVTAPGATDQGSKAPPIGSPSGGPSFDFFLRRARIMVYGSASKELSFFVETDQPNFGKGGDFATSMFIQDAFLTYTFAPEFKIDAGMMLVPLSHHTIEGAVGLNALDYHADMIRFPAGKIFRDTGVQFRGMLADNLIHYRLGVFEGVRNAAVPVAAPAMPPVPAPPALNDHGLPRFAGQVRVNLLGAESDFFLKGIYFSPKPLVSIGIGADMQPKAVYKLDGQPGTYFAFSADVFAEYPLSDTDEIIAKANVFNYAEGRSPIAGSTALAAGGTALYVEAGYRHDWIEPLVFIDYLKAKNDTLTIIAPHAGVNFWVTKHTFNLKADVGYRKADTLGAMAVTTTTKDILGTLQAQVFF